jgi:hypothetical protein
MQDQLPLEDRKQVVKFYVSVSARDAKSLAAHNDFRPNEERE